MSFVKRLCLVTMYHCQSDTLVHHLLLSDMEGGGCICLEAFLYFISFYFLCKTVPYRSCSNTGGLLASDVFEMYGVVNNF